MEKKAKATAEIQVEQQQPAAQRRRERQRQHVIEVATELYLEQGGPDGGFEKTTVEAIAERADISVRTFFRYFSSKTDVIYLDVKRAIEDLEGFVEVRLAREPVIAAVVGGSLDQVRWFVSNPVNRERLRRSLLAAEFKERLAVMREQAKTALSDLIAVKAPKPPTALESRMIASIVRDAVTHALDAWARSPNRNLEETVLRTLESLGPIVNEIASVSQTWQTATARKTPGKK